MRIAKARLKRERSGRRRVMRAIPVRRVQRPEKLWAFQVRKATALTGLKAKRLRLIHQNL
jgi:hypothetical protein